jgi:hypothetical protein
MVIRSNPAKWLAILIVLMLVEIPGFIYSASPYLIDFTLDSAAIYAIYCQIRLDHILSTIIIALCFMSCLAHAFAFSVGLASPSIISFITHDSLQDKYHYLLWVILACKLIAMIWCGRGIWKQYKRDLDKSARGLHHAGVLVVRDADSDQRSEAAN